MTHHKELKNIRHKIANSINGMYTIRNLLNKKIRYSSSKPFILGYR